MQIAAFLYTELTGKWADLEDMKIRFEKVVDFKELSEEEKKKMIKEVSDEARARLAPYSKPRNPSTSSSGSKGAA